jgi:hypothetical protein
MPITANNSGQLGSAWLGDAQLGNIKKFAPPGPPPAGVVPIAAHELSVIVLPDLFKWLYGEL